MPDTITTGGIIPLAPPATGRWSQPKTYRGPALPSPRGSGLDELQAPGMGSRFEPAPLPTEAPSYADLVGRARARTLLDEAYGPTEPYDPKLAALEETGKDVALGAAKRDQLLEAPSSTAPRPQQTWREALDLEAQNRERTRLEEALRSIGAGDEATLKTRQAELMASPEYALLDDDTKQTRLRGLQSELERMNMAEERRLLAAASIAAGKGLPSTAFQR